jgi:SAM-dependent methyltransferase
MREIAVSDGRRFTLHPLVVATPTVEALLIWGLGQCHLVEVDFEGCLAPATAETLTEKGLGSCSSQVIFNDARFARAIFGWDCRAELNGLREHLSEWQSAVGLDVGCGYGRLLLPLIDAGFTLDGVDLSLALIKDLSRTLGPSITSRALCVPIEEYVAPHRYGFAYAAMNTIRYLQTKSALRAHLRCMAENLLSGGIYLFCISLAPNPAKPYQLTWRFMWQEHNHEINWNFYSYSYVTEQIIEKIEIWEECSKRMIHCEYQIQANYSLLYLLSLISESLSPWRLEETLDLAFRPVKLTDSTRGTFWFKLRRI